MLVFVKRCFGLCLFGMLPFTLSAQQFEPLDVKGKALFHGERVYGLDSMAKLAAVAGVLQLQNAPEEWGHGGAAYGKRLGATVGYEAIRSTLAFGLDTTLHQDPRYFRSTSTNFWRRTGHALRGTVITHKDDGRETFSTWAVGSAFGAAYLSNMWVPDRLNTVGLGAKEGSLQLVFDFASNMRREFWADIKQKFQHRKP